MIKNGMRPIHPGEILREIYLCKEISEDEYQEKLRAFKEDQLQNNALNEKTIDNILKEEQDITENIAWAIAGYFETTPDFWLSMQTSYDQRVKELKKK